MSIQTLSISKVERVEEVKKMEISLKRVMTWALIFTNAYFLGVFFSRIF